MSGISVTMACVNCGTEYTHPLGTGFTPDCGCDTIYLVPKAVEIGSHKVVGWGHGEERRQSLDAREVVDILDEHLAEEGSV